MTEFISIVSSSPFITGLRRALQCTTSVVCANADGSNKNPCMMIGKSKAPACIVGRTWCFPYHNQKKAWMDQPICQIWFDTLFVPTVRKHTSRPVLLLLDNAPGHFEQFEKYGICVEFSPPNCTSWKHPCDQGTINALKTRYKLLYLRDVLSFYKVNEDKKWL
jgi:DDE superfamily endonuclease